MSGRDSRAGSSTYFSAQGPPPAAAAAAAGKQAPAPPAVPAPPKSAPAVQRPEAIQGQAVAAAPPGVPGAAPPPDPAAPAPEVEPVEPHLGQLPLAHDHDALERLLRQVRDRGADQQAVAAAPPGMAAPPPAQPLLSNDELVRLRQLLARRQEPMDIDMAELFLEVMDMLTASYADVVADFRDQVVRCASHAPSLPEGCKWTSVKPTGLRGDVPMDILAKIIDGVNMYTRALLMALSGDNVDAAEVARLAIASLRFVREFIRHQLIIQKAVADAGGAGKIMRDTLSKVFDPHQPASIHDAQAELALFQQALQIEALQAKIAARHRKGNGNGGNGGNNQRRGGSGGGRGNGGNNGGNFNNGSRRGGRGGHSRTDNSSSSGGPSASGSAGQQ